MAWALPGNVRRYSAWLESGVFFDKAPELTLSDKFPVLFAVAKWVLPLPATSLKIERINSAAAIVDTKLRRSMLPETLSG